MNRQGREQTSINNYDPAEIAKFSGQPDDWWDFDGPFATLHHINLPRLDFIERFGSLQDAKVLDIGCGGGILAEGMAARGATVTGIDLSSDALSAAQIRATETASGVEYQEISAEQFATQNEASYDIVVCMELLEHVPEPQQLVAAAARLTKPNGRLIISTINRTPRAFSEAILAAEYLLKAVPRGTHRYDRFIRPSELSKWCRTAGLTLDHLSGLGYNPFTGTAWLREDPVVNYLAHFHHDD